MEGEWGEKVERVFEFLVDTGGLRRRERRFEEVVEREREEEGAKGGLRLATGNGDGEGKDDEPAPMDGVVVQEQSAPLPA